MSENKIIITNCYECANLFNTGSTFRGPVCRGTNKEIISGGSIPDWCPKLNKERKECKHCSFISKTFPSADQMTKREYWLMTEVFVYLHGGKDYCDNKNINYISRDKESKE